MRIGLVIMVLVGVLFQAGQDPKDNGAILSGPNFAFILVAPEGWILDDSSGRQEGLPAVFYKRGDSWSRAKVVMYANPVSKTKGKTVESIIGEDVHRFRQLNPAIAVEDGTPIAVANGRKLPVKTFRGTKEGDTEVVAYADESSCVVMLVLSGRPDLVQEEQASFAALLRTYTFITDEVRD